MDLQVFKLYDQDYDAIKKDCLKKGKLFQDPKFTEPIQKYPGCKVKRPMELCKDPHFFINQFSRLDVQQGELGDCWMVSAITNLTQHPKLFERVVPLDQHYSSDYAGIFRFRFWQYGRWVEVVVDDQLLVENGHLKFARSTEQSEYWVPLLEKAYAKLYGSYEELEGGNPGIAMEDLTGGVAEEFSLNEASHTLFDILNKSHARGSLLATCIYGDGGEAITPMGLVKGHAYSITKVHSIEHSTLQKRANLLRIKNPWANNTEWKGAWSDGSPQWNSISPEERKKIGLVFGADGEFWISYEDFQSHFSTANICHMTLESLSLFEDGDRKNWVITKVEDSFKNNKKHLVTLCNADDCDSENKCTLIVSLMQKPNNSDRLRFQNHIACLIYDHDRKKQIQTDPSINSREIVQRHKLRPGKYAIVPESQKGDDYLLHIFTEHPHHLEAH